MHKMILAGAAAVLAMVSAPVLAESVFDGTWKGDVKTGEPSKKPSTTVLKDGVYSCSTCVPAIKVAADGAFHAVAGSPYYDAMAVTVVDARTVKQATRKAGKTVGETTGVVSADGQTIAYSYNDMSAPNGVAVTGKGVEKRVAPAPKGAHASSGSWVATTTGTEVSDSGLLFTMAVASDDTVNFSMPTGVAYTVKVGGPEAPVTGDPGWTSVSIKRTGPATLLETDYRAGKPITTLAMTVSPDGKRMTLVIDDLLRTKRSTFYAMKQ